MILGRDAAGIDLFQEEYCMGMGESEAWFGKTKKEPSSNQFHVNAKTYRCLMACINDYRGQFRQLVRARARVHVRAAAVAQHPHCCACRLGVQAKSRRESPT